MVVLEVPGVDPAGVSTLTAAFPERLTEISDSCQPVKLQALQIFDDHISLSSHHTMLSAMVRRRYRDISSSRVPGRAPTRHRALWRIANAQGCRAAAGPSWRASTFVQFQRLVWPENA